MYFVIITIKPPVTLSFCENLYCFIFSVFRFLRNDNDTVKIKLLLIKDNPFYFKAYIKKHFN